MRSQKIAAASSSVSGMTTAPTRAADNRQEQRAGRDTFWGMTEPVQWGKVIDQTRCIGCHACSTACKSENAVPLGVNRTYVKYVDVGKFPAARRAFQVTRCNQCEHPPCVEACPTTAMYRRPDGIVDFDKNICIGCKACIAACPYDARYLRDDGTADKCTFCFHRVAKGQLPACVAACPTKSLIFGDVNDADSDIARLLRTRQWKQMNAEAGTQPNLYFLI